MSWLASGIHGLKNRRSGTSDDVEFIEDGIHARYVVAVYSVGGTLLGLGRHFDGGLEVLR